MLADASGSKTAPGLLLRPQRHKHGRRTLATVGGRAKTVAGVMRAPERRASRGHGKGASDAASRELVRTVGILGLAMELTSSSEIRYNLGVGKGAG
jgi:hypothetical protein